MSMKMTMAEFVGLEPCPFCDGDAKVFHYSSAIRDEVWRVVCDKPFCAQGPDGYTEAEAIAAWNTRAERTCENVDKFASDGFFICGNCGFGDNAIELTPNYCPSCGARVIKSDHDLRQEVGE